jgi:hypothetical protein
VSEYKLTEEMVRKILATPPTTIHESGVFNDLKVSEKERLENARRILNSCKEVSE